jgi:uncharacterized membrane protein YjgN (DUF898 family)
MDARVDTAPQVPAIRHQLRFEGSAAEYFKIWIVNLALTIVTLGIFSAWAKVRSKRYFYGNTYIGEHNFDYHGQPLRILLGRAFAVGILLLYGLTVAFAPLLTFVLAIAVFFATPWLVNAALRFNARNTSYRNIRFNFTGTYGQAFVAYIAWPMLVAITLGTTYPLARRARTHFNINNHSFGGRYFQSQIPGRDIYGIYLTALGLALGLIFVLVIVLGVGAGLAMAVSGIEKGAHSPFITVLASVTYAAVALFLMTFTGTRVFNLALNNTILADRYRFEATLSATSMIGLVFSNLMLTLVTLGLYYPWARVRTLNYVTAHLAVTGATDPADFTSELVAGQGAVGEEIANFFDVDIGL